MNDYNLAEDYGGASFNTRHRALEYGNFLIPAAGPVILRFHATTAMGRLISALICA